MNLGVIILDMNTIYAISDYKLFSRKGDNYIVIFPNIPFWIATTELGIKALQSISESHTISEIAYSLFGKADNDVITILGSFFGPLIECNAMYEMSNPPEQLNDILPQKPNKITFLQTMNCNLRCKHCCVSEMSIDSLKSMSLEDAKEALRRSSRIMYEGKKGLSFLGGEPLCGDRFIELLDFAHDLGFEIGLSTNGVLIDDVFAKAAKRNSVNIQISLDGTNKESHEYVRGKGTWEKAINAIDILNKYNVDIQTNLVYHTKNIDQLEEYFDFALEKNINKVRLISLMNMGRAVNNFEIFPLDEFVDRIYLLMKKRPDIIKLLDETSFMGLVMCAKFSQKMISCGAGIITVTISPSGDIYPCLNLYSNEFKISNIFDTDYEEKFYSSTIRKMFHDINISSSNEHCNMCELRYFCGGKCRGETYQELKDIFAPYPQCDSWKRALEKVFWILTEFPELGEDKYQKVVSSSGEYLSLWH